MEGRRRGLVIKALFELLASACLAGMVSCGPAREPTLVDISRIIPGVQLDIRYHSSYNFVGRRIDGYETAKCLLTPEAAAALATVQEELSEHSRAIKIYDCYRPQRAVDHFVRWAKDTDDVAMKPLFYPEVPKSRLFAEGYIAERSGHSRGSTVDLTIVPLPVPPQEPCEAGRPCHDNSIDMGSPYDFFAPVSHALSQSVSESQHANRMLLRETMQEHGFEPLPEEWWHFTLREEPFPDTYFDFPIE